MGKDLGDRLGGIVQIGSRFEQILAVGVVAGFVGIGLAAVIGLPVPLIGGAAFTIVVVPLGLWAKPWRAGRPSPMDSE
jgi:tetrahydromethanopterin S-methyltransferase subunit C